MKRSLFPLLAAVGLFLCAVSASPASADNSHARIVRLSLVQGDVRFARSFHQDPLTDSNAVWEVAPLNLPLRQGYVLSTDSGRAEVEFENGAMAFLSSNTVLELYDLSLRDGGRITRLVLRQGSAAFYVNAATGDYFSVTGGDFTVEATRRATFRMDNFDDGSSVNVQQGHLSVLRNEQSTPLEKGQSLSVQAGSTGEPVIGRLGETDDFDHWVSGRIESSVTATTRSSQYVSSPYYSAGFADLYNYGSWYPVAGYGNCWRPFGAGFGWSPFDFGSWYMDPVFGWSFMGSAAWGWLPYHYGSWVFSPVYGWAWVPTGFGFGPILPYRPVTAVWVRSGSTLGLVLAHPTDQRGKTPVNIGQGIFPVRDRSIAQTTIATGSSKWSVVKQAPRDTLSAALAASSTAPTRVSRTLLNGSTGSRTVTVGRDSSIVYDRNDHRFVNTNSAPAAASATVKTEVAAPPAQKPAPVGAPAAEAFHVPASTAPPRAVVPPRAAPTPPPPSRAAMGGSSRAGSSWGGSHASSGAHASGTSHASSAPAAHSSGRPR